MLTTISPWAKRCLYKASPPISWRALGAETTWSKSSNRITDGWCHAASKNICCHCFWMVSTLFPSTRIITEKTIYLWCLLQHKNPEVSIKASHHWFIVANKTIPHCSPLLLPQKPLMEKVHETPDFVCKCTHRVTVPHNYHNHGHKKANSTK